MRTSNSISLWKETLNGLVQSLEHFVRGVCQSGEDTKMTTFVSFPSKPLLFTVIKKSSNRKTLLKSQLLFSLQCVIHRHWRTLTMPLSCVVILNFDIRDSRSNFKTTKALHYNIWLTTIFHKPTEIFISGSIKLADEFIHKVS